MYEERENWKRKGEKRAQGAKGGDEERERKTKGRKE